MRRNEQQAVILYAYPYLQQKTAAWLWWLQLHKYLQVLDSRSMNMVFTWKKMHMIWWTSREMRFLSILIPHLTVNNIRTFWIRTMKYPHECGIIKKDTSNMHKIELLWNFESWHDLQQHNKTETRHAMILPSIT